MSSSSTNVSKTASSGTRRLPGLRVGRVAGIEVHLDLSLLIIFVLIGTSLALVQARAVSEVSRDEWSSTSLREIMQPMSIEEAVEVDDDATTALDRLTRASVDALPVRNRENQIVGSILQRDIARWLWLSQGEETAQR